MQKIKELICRTLDPESRKPYLEELSMNGLKNALEKLIIEKQEEFEGAYDYFLEIGINDMRMDDIARAIDDCEEIIEALEKCTFGRVDETIRDIRNDYDA